MQRLCIGWFLAGLLTGAMASATVYYGNDVVWVEGYTQAVYDQGYADGQQEGMPHDDFDEYEFGVL